MISSFIVLIINLVYTLNFIDFIYHHMPLNGAIESIINKQNQILEYTAKRQSYAL